MHLELRCQKYDTIIAARQILPGDTKIAFHSHETAGIGTVGYVAAIKAVQIR